MFIPTKQKIDKLLQFLKRKTNYGQNTQFRGEYANGRTNVIKMHRTINDNGCCKYSLHRIDNE